MERAKETQTFSDIHQHSDAEQRDGESDRGQQLGDGDDEAGGIVTTDAYTRQPRAHVRGCWSLVSGKATND